MQAGQLQATTLVDEACAQLGYDLSKRFGEYLD